MKLKKADKIANLKKLDIEKVEKFEFSLNWYYNVLNVLNMWFEKA